MTIIAFQYQSSRHEYIVSHLKQYKKSFGNKQQPKDSWESASVNATVAVKTACH